MKQFIQFLFSALVALLVACNSGGTQVASNSGGISGTGDGSGKSSISGASYKGPMMKDSIIRLFPIVNGVISSQAVETKTLSNTGDFTASVDDGIYSVQASGRYYDEVAGIFSTTKTKLKAVVSITNNQKIIANVLTHLAHDYTVARIKLGDSYTVATEKAKTRTLNLLKPITGETLITADFNKIGLNTSDNSNSNDAAYLAYISALVIQTAADNSTLTVNSIVNELAEDVTNDNAIDEATLNALTISHANIDETTVDNNLGTIFSGNNSANITSTVTEIDIFNPALSEPTYEIINSGSDYRFFFDGSMTDGSGGISGRSILIGGSYQIQISQDSNFGTLEITASSIPSNTYQSSVSNFTGSGKRYVRVRKVKNNGQVSQWSAVLEFTI